MPTILERIKQYYESKGMSAREFSLSIDRSAAYFSNTLKSGSSPGGDLLSSIFDTYPDLNIDWVFTGRGDMISENDKVNDSPSDYQPADLIDKAIDKKIDRKIEDLSISLKELIAYEINNKIEISIKKYHEKKIEDGY